MNLNLHSQPLTWYCDKLDRQEPFCLTSYGDGEWIVALREQTGNRRYTGYREHVTPALEQELRDGLTLRDATVLRATDFNLLNTELDWARPLALRIRRLLEEVKGTSEWYDGVVWDSAAREAGSLNPLLKALWKRDVVVVNNGALMTAPGLRPRILVPCPMRNAVSALDRMESDCRELYRDHDHDETVFFLCCGLAGTPLALRLHKALPRATCLDLGSSLDVLVKASPERAWRKIMYADEAVWRETVRKHTEGVGE